MGMLLALAAFRCALSAPGSDDLSGRVQQLIQKGDLAQARSEVRSAIREHPEQADLYNFLGVVETQQGHYAAAEAAFLAAIRRNARMTGAYLNLGRLYQENSAKHSPSIPKAIQTYRRVLGWEPDNQEAHFQLAVLLLRQEEFRPSLQHLSRLPGDAQQRPQALAIRCAAEAALGMRLRAGRSAGLLLKRPDLSEADVLIALPALWKAKQAELAMLLLRGLAERKLITFEGLRRLGLFEEVLGHLPAARANLDHAATQNGSAELLLELARVAYKQQDRDAALAYLVRARDLAPRNAAVHFFMGMVYVDLDVVVEAEKALALAVQLDPGNPRYNYAMGAALEARKPDEAIEYFRRYCVLKGNDPRGRLVLANAYFDIKDYDSARKEATAVAGYPQTAAGAHYLLGRLAIRDQNLPEALAELLKAAQGDPSNAAVYAELGFVYLDQDDYEAARKVLERAIVLDPENHRANLQLLRLYQRAGDPRAEAQARRFEQVDQKRSEKTKAILRTLQLRPY